MGWRRGCGLSENTKLPPIRFRDEVGLHSPTFPYIVRSGLGRVSSTVKTRTMLNNFQPRLDVLASAPDLPDTCSVRRILIIDDDCEMVGLLAQSLAQEGFNLSSAQSGEDGLESGRDKALDLILLDVNLPDVNG